MTSMNAHQHGMELFEQGRYEEAVVQFEELLRSNGDSELWNDWAVAQAATGRAGEAKRGFETALRLDPRNHLAAANLVALLESLGRDWEAARFLDIAGPELVQKNRGAVLLALARAGDARLLAGQLFKDLVRLPVQDPALSRPMADALRRSRHSGFLARQFCALLTRFPSETLGTFLQAVDLLAARDQRFLSARALWYMNQGDYAAALAMFQSVFDSNPADLFAESKIIECEHQRHASCNPFEGIEEYLGKSFCDRPWKHLELGVDGGAYLCCPAWLPVCIGIPSRQSAETIWNSEVAAEVRRAVLEGSFEYCSKVHCPRIAARNLPRRSSARKRFPELRAVLAGGESGPRASAAAIAPRPAKLVLSYDRTCNLACPQCRKSFYAAGRAQQEQMERDYEQFIVVLAKDVNTLKLDGSGEVFGSKHSRRVLGLLTRDQYPKLKFHIISNGQLFDRRAFEAFDLAGRLACVEISVDAACPETYAVVRRGGDFNRLLRNLEFLDGLRMKEGEKFRLKLNFVVSALNFREIPEFVTLARRFHADSVLFTIMRNWGHFSKEDFERMNVASISNPLHEEFVEILSSPELLDPIVDMGSLRTYQKKNG